MVTNKESQKIFKITEQKYFWPIILFAFSFLIYSNTLQHDYTQDDAIAIYDNMFTTKGLEGISSIFKYDSFYGFFKEEGKDKLVSGGRYRPLSIATFAVEWELFGRSPGISHFINILLYGLTSLLLYFTIKSITNKRKKNVAYLAVLVSFIFIAHPIHTEVVANIKGRDEIMSLLFSLLAMLSALKYSEKKAFKWLLLGGISLFLGCLSKENAISFLLIIPTTIWFFRHKKKALAAVTLFCFSAVFLYLIIRFSILGFDLGEPSKELMNNPFIKIEDGRYIPFDWAEKWSTIIFILGKYLQLIFFPHPLTHDYYPRHIEVMQFSSPGVWLSLVMFTTLILYTIYSFRKRDLTSYAIIYFLLSLSLVSNILFPIGTNLSERFLYMPSFAFALWLGYMVQKGLNTKRKKLVIMLFVTLCTAYSIKSIDRNTVWKDNFTLFTHDVKISNNSAKIRNAAGGSLANAAAIEKNKEKREKMLNEAIEHLKKALYIHPNYKSPYLILGNCYYMLEDFETAGQYYQSALSIDPDFQEAIMNSAINDRELGRYYGSKVGDLDKSLLYLKRAEQILDEDYETMRLIGTAYGYIGRRNDAVRYFEKALSLAPNSAQAHINLGKAYGNAGNQERSNFYFEKAQQIDPNALD